MRTLAIGEPAGQPGSPQSKKIIRVEFRCSLRCSRPQDESPLNVHTAGGVNPSSSPIAPGRVQDAGLTHGSSMSLPYFLHVSPWSPPCLPSPFSYLCPGWRAPELLLLLLHHKGLFTQTGELLNFNPAKKRPIPLMNYRWSTGG
ncbi:unnamed protein product [Arctogadus glacialis]